MECKKRLSNLLLNDLYCNFTRKCLTEFMKKMVTKGNIINVLLIGVFLVLVFVPSAKALMIRGLMEIGLFKPGLTNAAVISAPVKSIDLSEIKFKDASGKTVDLKSLKGKVIFLNFWATWCPPCLAEMPAINKLYERFKADKNVIFLLVDADGDFVKAHKYMDRKKFKLPVYQVASNIPKEIYKGSLPTTVVFDKHGRVVYNEIGAANYGSEKFINFIKGLAGSNL